MHDCRRGAVLNHPGCIRVRLRGHGTAACLQANLAAFHVQAPLFAVHGPEAADAAQKATAPIDRLRAFGMTLSLKTTPADSAGAAPDGPNPHDRAAADLVRGTRLRPAMNRLVVREPPPSPLSLAPVSMPSAACVRMSIHVVPGQNSAVLRDENGHHVVCVGAAIGQTIDRFSS